MSANQTHVCKHARTESPTTQLDSACLLAPTLRDQEPTEGTVARDYTDGDEVQALQGVLQQSSNLEEPFVSVVAKVQIYLCGKESA